MKHHWIAFAVAVVAGFFLRSWLSQLPLFSTVYNVTSGMGGGGSSANSPAS
jgi:hypothetical protein